MSDASAPIEGTGEVDPGNGPVETPEVQPEAATQEPEVEYLDLDDTIANKHVRVKVDGEEVSVPLGEALQGYQRQAAFTRHSQELAEQRREAQDALRLSQAMQSDPGLTVQILARHAGVSVEEFLGMTPAQQQAAVQQEPEFDDPLEREIYQERQARLALEARITQRESDEYLHRVVTGMKQEYGLNDEQMQAVVSTAMQLRLGVEHLPLVYQSLVFQAQQQARAEQANGQQTQDEQRRQAAADQAALIAPGTGSVGGTNAPPNPQYSTYREGITAAYDEVFGRDS